MKKFNFLLVVLTFVCQGLHAQAPLENRPHSPAQKATVQLLDMYDLTEEQFNQAYHIQQEKYNALTEINALKEKDIKSYIIKRKLALNQADISFLMLLEEPQIEIYRQQQQTLQQARFASKTQWRKAGKSEDEAEILSLEIEL